MNIQKHGRKIAPNIAARKSNCDHEKCKAKNISESYTAHFCFDVKIYSLKGILTVFPIIFNFFHSKLTRLTIGQNQIGPN